ncbi:MAG: fatty acid hydroxylase family protein, partial [Nitrospirota bacterium]|nr:fatty acid hydroxylase family protein [Nitrospirota bacterium]MDX2420861.1 fatty acid hydroxylase family protein [Nitrospirota bacterium]
MLTGSWYQQKYHLDRMTWRDLVWAYLLYPSIQIYFALFLGSIVFAIVLYPYFSVSPFRLGGSILGTLVAYPFVEYGVHRFVLHGRYLYRSPWTAALWKRIHYDHHQ